MQRVLSNTGLQVAAGPSGAYLLVEPRMSGEAPADLSPVVVSAAELADPQKETYTAPRSSVYLSSEDIDRFGRVSVGDLLQGIPGVQVGDSRNGGALDVNIRGIQGQSRVAVRVDGAEQALDVYRGYAGTQQRSYIDPDLVSSVTVDKGPSTRSGAIGGSVEMRTIGVKDILVDGKDLGVRFTGDVWNNGVAPQHRSASSKTENLSSVPHDDRGSLFGSQAYRSDRNWTRQDNRRIGGDLNNVARFETDFGDFKLDLGGSFQVEDIQPQKSVVTTLHDINANRTLRDATRQEYGLNGKLEFKPVERLTLWGGGRYSHFNSKDNGISASPRREDRDMRFITVSRPGYYGSMMWFPDQNGQYTDATDPRLNNGIVTNNTNNPFEGIPFDEFGPANVTVHPSRVTNVVTGYNYSKKGSSRGGGFSPAFGINFELAPDTFVYASYTEGLRLPSLFETSQGTLQVEPGKDLKPERSRSWEIGASALRDSLLADGDSAAIKLAYFNNTIKNYITRYYDPGQMGLMTFSNTDSYRTSGLELQSHYDAGRVFADLSATYYLKTETCDAAFAARLRAGANRYQRTENTPNCTPGSFMGSYTNTQNPPRLATNLTAGLRFFDQALTLGGRMTYTSGPTATADKPWQVGATTPQIEYRSVQLFDLFLKYKLFEHTELNASLQNLTDRYYLDPLAQSFMPAPGRTLRVGMQAKF